MIQKELSEENKEISSRAYELYEKHGFKDGNDFVDWLEAERQTGIRPRSRRRRRLQGFLLAIVGILCAVVAILCIMLFRQSPRMELSEKGLSELKVMMLVLDQKEDERVVAFGDTHFDYGNATLANVAKTLLDRDVRILKENPKMKVRMAGYTSAHGTEEDNQRLSEARATAVRDYLIAKGIAPNRVAVIGYGRTRPALYEVSPGNIDSTEAKANMRVLFEVIVE